MSESSTIAVTAERSDTSHIYCLDCGYVISNLDRPRCPECGRRFNPENAKTFATSPRMLHWRLWIAPFVRGLLFIICTAGAFAVSLHLQNEIMINDGIRWHDNLIPSTAIERIGLECVVVVLWFQLCIYSLVRWMRNAMKGRYGRASVWVVMYIFTMLLTFHAIGMVTYDAPWYIAQVSEYHTYVE